MGKESKRKMNEEVSAHELVFQALAHRGWERRVISNPDVVLSQRKRTTGICTKGGCFPVSVGTFQRHAHQSPCTMFLSCFQLLLMPTTPQNHHYHHQPNPPSFHAVSPKQRVDSCEVPPLSVAFNCMRAFVSFSASSSPERDRKKKKSQESPSVAMA